MGKARHKKKETLGQMTSNMSTTDMSKQFTRFRHVPRRGAIFVKKNPFKELHENLNIIPHNVFNVLNNVEIAKEERRQEEIMDKLKNIQQNVSRTLQNNGYDTSSEIQMSQQSFSIRIMKENLSKQQPMLNTISEHLKLIGKRTELLQDISDWLESCSNLDEGTLPMEEMEAKEKEFIAINQEVLSAFDYAKEVTGKIRDMGYFLFKEAGFTENAPESSYSKQFHIRFPTAPAKEIVRTVVEETQILAEPGNFDMACTEVKNVFEHMMRVMQKNTVKNVLRHGQKQFKFLMKAVEKRLTEAKGMEEELLTLRMKLEQMTRVSDRWKTNHEKMELQVNAMDAKILKLQAQIENLQKSKDDIKNKLKIVEEKNSSLLADLNAKPTVVTITKEVIIEKKKSGPTQPVINQESLVNAAVQPLREELESMKEALCSKECEVKQLSDEITVLKENEDKLKAKLKAEQAMSGEKRLIEEKSKEEQIKDETMFKMKSLRDASESLERQIAQLMNELDCKNELIEYQERRIGTMKKELGIINLEDIKEGPGSDKGLAEDTKRTMMHMKKEFDTEVNRLKSHLEKEKSRHEASLRKLEQYHKEQLLSTHKASLHLLRSINRFKESVAVILDRENLLSAAHDIRRIPNLPTEESSGDAKLFLVQMARSAVELLVTVEFKLSQALMNKRLEIKENSIAKNFAAKDLQVQMEAASKAKQATESLTERLREVTYKLAQAEETITELKTNNEVSRYHALYTQYRRLMGQYTSLQQDMTKLQLEYKKVVREKDAALKGITEQKVSMAKVVEEQQTLIATMQSHLKKHQKEHKEELQMSIREMRHNLSLLDEAFEENYITKEMHMMTAELLKRCMELPALRLSHLMHKYIAFRALQDAKQQVQKRLDDSLLGDRHPELRTILSRVDERLEQSNKIWKEQQDKLVKQRGVIIQQISAVFSDIISETGLLLVQPTYSVQAATSSTSIYPRSTMTRSSPSSVPSTTPRTKFPRIPSSLSGGDKMPSHIAGTGLNYPIDKSEGTWTLPDLNQYKGLVTLTTPRILDFDINQHVRAASKALRRARRRMLFPTSKANFCDYSGNDVLSMKDLYSHNSAGDVQSVDGRKTSENSVIRPE